MKIILCIVLFLTLPKLLPAQMTEDEKKAWIDSFKIHSQTEKDITNGVANKEIADGDVQEEKKVTFTDLLNTGEEIDTDKEVAVFQGDVVSYFGLKEKYNTDLKKAVFKKTDEYSEYLAKIREERMKLRDKVFRKCLRGSFDEYDFKRKGFLYHYHSEATIEAPKLKVLPTNYYNPVNFLALPIVPHRYTDIFTGENGVSQVMFIKVPHDIAVQLDDSLGRNRDTDGIATAVDFCFLYKVSGINMISEKRPWPSTYSVPASDWTRVLIGNRNTGDVYFDKIYSLSKK